MPLFSRLTNGFNANSRGAANANANANTVVPGPGPGPRPGVFPTPAVNYAPPTGEAAVKYEPEYTFQAGVGDDYVHEEAGEVVVEEEEEYYYEEQAAEVEVEVEVEIDDIPAGSHLEVKRLDELYDLEIRDWVLQESTVPEPKYKAEKDEYKHFAFTVVRKFEKRSDPADFLYQTLLDIKSPHLKKVCEEVIGSVRGISWTFTPLRLNPQIILTFLPGFDAYAAKLREKDSKTEDEEITSSHLDFFLDYIRLDNAKNLETINNLLAHGEITFDLLWVILVPRTTIYTRCIVTEEPRAFTMTHAERGTSNGIPCWDIEGEYVEYNAKRHAEKAAPGTPKFGLATFKPVQIMIFEGAVQISSLPHYPLKYHPHAENLRTLLVERGKKWCSMQGVQHKHFKGMGFNRYTGKYSVDSRIVIDWKTFIESNPNYNLPNVIKTLDDVDIEKHKTSYGKAEESGDPSIKTIVSDEHLLLTSPILYGFSLADKLWLEFNIENVSTFEWSSEPFENLVLPPAQKKLIRSLVETHNKDSTGFDDFVKGKGRGLIINLFGNPGVGKSLTAEATSEHVKKPLYIVGAGDLGITATELDNNLTQIFSVSSSWGAVVLIDEADVFLEERSVHDLQRNAVVAVFLRQLEYFRGILFMTTNRVKSFDEAFQSRIHVSLRYHDLKPDARRQIWVAFLKKVKGQDTLCVSDEELKDLSARAVNGRQIKNIVKTASALAAADDEPLRYEHLALVLDMIDQFEVDKREMP